VGHFSRAPKPDYEVVDLPNYTVIPGLVGMHEHLFYPSGSPVYIEQAVSFPRLYLAGGVTTGAYRWRPRKSHRPHGEEVD
jgi:dihydroorotase-like cyclic amidohydrolase